MGDSPEVWEANAARFFWDLYDTTTIFDYDGTYTDNNLDSFHNLLIEWDDFPAGTGDGDRAQSGLDGRNAWDFRKYYPNSFSEIYVNCLDGSVPNSG